MSRQVGAQGRDSRQRILEATLRVAADRGYEGTTIGLVSEHSGLPASSIYWHFKNKDQLLAAALEHGFSQWRAVAPAATGLGPGERLEDAALERFVKGAAAVQTRPEFWHLGLMLSLRSQIEEPSARRRFLEAHREFVELMADWWLSVLPEPIAERRLALQVAQFHVAVLDGFYVARSAGQGWDLLVLARLVARGVAARIVRWQEGAR